MRSYILLLLIALALTALSGTYCNSKLYTPPSADNVEQVEEPQ